MRTYLELLRLPRVAAALTGSLVGRLHESMLSFAVILLISPVHGYAGSGAVLAAAGIGQSVGAPLWGRRADRSGHARVLLVTAAAQAVALLVLSRVQGEVLPAVLAGAVVGFVTPPLTPAVRAAVPRLVPAARSSAAYALESTLQELVFVAGPLVAGAVAARAGAATAFVVAAGCTLVGTVVYVLAVQGLPAGGPGSAVAQGRGRVGLGAAVPVLVGGGAFLVVLCLQSLAVVQRVSGGGALPSASWFLAATSVGSLVGGLVIGPRLAAGAPPAPRMGILAAGVVPLVIGASLPDPAGAVVLAVGSFLFGTTIAPAATTLFDRLSRTVPAGRSTEAFGWMGAAMGAGGVIGDGGGGWLLDRAGPVPVLVVAALVAGLVSVVLPRTLAVDAPEEPAAAV
ncbi:MAG: MFS transporter [Cellulomonas sp.]|nr:MFS transporter [Cellulomonas sp.]